MKKLFLAIMIPILFVLGTPALLAAIMYDGSGEDAMPVHLYNEDADAEAMLYAELTSSLDAVTNEEEENFDYSNFNPDVLTNTNNDNIPKNQGKVNQTNSLADSQNV